MTAAITGATTKSVSPNLGAKAIFIKTPATADSGDTIDVTSATVTGGETLKYVDFVVCWDKTSGDIVTATDSSGVITIDAAGGTTDHIYCLLVIGR
jgi:hypothetical protein